MFQTLDNSIITALEVFTKELNTLSFDDSNSIEFILDDNFKSDFLSQECSGLGIYFFELKINEKLTLSEEASTILKEIKTLWKYGYEHGMWSPGVKERRVREHSEFSNGWIPFYIGKSKHLNRRILEHVFQDSKKTSFSMKLKARKNLYGLTFRINFIKIDVKNYDMIVPYVESVFRGRYNPIIGKQ